MTRNPRSKAQAKKPPNSGAKDSGINKAPKKAPKTGKDRKTYKFYKNHLTGLPLLWHLGDLRYNPHTGEFGVTNEDAMTARAYGMQCGASGQSNPAQKWRYLARGNCPQELLAKSTVPLEHVHLPAYGIYPIGHDLHGMSSLLLEASMQRQATPENPQSPHHLPQHQETYAPQQVQEYHQSPHHLPQHQETYAPQQLQETFQSLHHHHPQYQETYASQQLQENHQSPHHLPRHPENPQSPHHLPQHQETYPSQGLQEIYRRDQVQSHPSIASEQVNSPSNAGCSPIAEYSSESERQFGAETNDNGEPRIDDAQAVNQTHIVSPDTAPEYTDGYQGVFTDPEAAALTTLQLPENGLFNHDYTSKFTVDSNNLMNHGHDGTSPPTNPTCVSPSNLMNFYPTPSRSATNTSPSRNVTPSYGHDSSYYTNPNNIPGFHDIPGTPQSNQKWNMEYNMPNPNPFYNPTNQWLLQGYGTPPNEFFDSSTIGDGFGNSALENTDPQGSAFLFSLERGQ